VIPVIIIIIVGARPTPFSSENTLRSDNNNNNINYIMHTITVRSYRRYILMNYVLFCYIYIHIITITLNNKVFRPGIM